MCDDRPSGSGECRCKVERVPNFAQPRLLLELAKKPSHGYELLERLSQDWGDAPDPGNFYRMLRSLEEEGLVCSNWDTQSSGPARRVYEVSDQGLEYLQAWVVTLKQTYRSLGQFLSDYETLLSRERSQKDV
jgi:PadR family transcriptional regulator PadR